MKKKNLGKYKQLWMILRFTFQFLKEMTSNLRGITIIFPYVLTVHIGYSYIDTWL